MTTSSEEVLDALTWRYATKQFDPCREIPADIWDALLDSLVLTPSSFGLQPWKFFVVEDPSLRANLRAESWNQAQVTDASKYLVLASRTDLTERDIDSWIDCLAMCQGKTPDDFAALRGMISGFTAAMPQEQRRIWNSRQVYIALGQLMESAALLGIDTCPMEGINPEAYDKLLGLETGEYATVVACALGYRSADDKYASLPKARYARERVIEIL
jgi:nitroreductase